MKTKIFAVAAAVCIVAVPIVAYNGIRTAQRNANKNEMSEFTKKLSSCFDEKKFAWREYKKPSETVLDVHLRLGEGHYDSELINALNNAEKTVTEALNGSGYLGKVQKADIIIDAAGGKPAVTYKWRPSDNGGMALYYVKLDDVDQTEHLGELNALESADEVCIKLADNDPDIGFAKKYEDDETKNISVINNKNERVF